MSRLTIVLIAVLLSSCTLSQGNTNVVDKAIDSHQKLLLTDEELARLGLTQATATVESIPVRLTLAGTIQANPNLTTPVASLVPGRIENVKVQQGDLVQKGQILARIRSDEVGELESDYLSKLVDFDADRKEAQVQVSLKEKIFNRRKVLLDEKIASRSDYELSESELEQARLDLAAVDDKRQALYRSTRERISLFGLPESELVRLNKSRTIQAVFDIRSPRAGIVIGRDADPGQTIESGKTLFQVSDLSRVWVIAQVFERDVRFVKKGLPVDVEVESFPGEKFFGIVDFIGSQIDSETRTMPIRATIANPAIRLKPEMFARIIVKTGTATGLAVPRGAVQQIGEVSVVYIAADKNHFDERQVKTGQTVGDMVEITDGLKSGERVVVNGSLQLLGQAVRRLSQ